MSVSPNKSLLHRSWQETRNTKATGYKYVSQSKSISRCANSQQQRLYLTSDMLNFTVTQNSDCPEPEFEENQMIRTGPGSKFLYPKTLYFTSSAEATVQCNKLDLEPATIAGKWEYKHLVQFIFGKFSTESIPRCKRKLLISEEIIS